MNSYTVSRYGEDDWQVVDDIVVQVCIAFCEEVANDIAAALACFYDLPDPEW